MQLKSTLAMAYALVVATMLFVHEPGFSQSTATEAAQPETERTCSKAKDAAPRLSPEHDRIDGQSQHRSSSEPVQVVPSRSEFATFGMGYLSVCDLLWKLHELHPVGIEIPKVRSRTNVGMTALSSTRLRSVHAREVNRSADHLCEILPLMLSAADDALGKEKNTILRESGYRRAE